MTQLMDHKGAAETEAITAFLAGSGSDADLPTPEWGPIGEEVFRRTYSRTVVEPDGRQRLESWAEAVRRVVLGNLSYAPESTQLPDEAVDLFRLIYNFGAIPAGRHLWVTGTEASHFSRNCFAGETEVITREGVFPIGDLVNRTVEIVDGAGHWVEAQAKSYGVQSLMRIVLTRGKSERKEVFATPDHGWFTTYKGVSGKQTVRRATQELRPGHRLASVRAGQTPRRCVKLSPAGVQHGFVFGDGTLPSAPTLGAVAYFCGEKDRAMVKWFPGHDLHAKADGTLWAGGNPRSWKQLPSLAEASSYLYGFLAGYFAADGSVHPSGNVRLSSASRENLLGVRSICARLGIPTRMPTAQSRSGYGDAPSDLWTITLDGGALTEDFFLIPEHRERWANRDHRTDDFDVACWTVESIEPTNRVEEVFCFEVPTTHSFVLAENILTSNCWVSGWSRRTSDHVRFLAARLFEGGGVGSNYSADLLKVTTPIAGDIRLSIVCRNDHLDIEAVRDAAGSALVPEVPEGATVLVVEDTREGWVDAWCRLIDLSTEPGSHQVVFDVSDIRPHGAPLKTFGGNASGPAPLARSALNLSAILSRVAAEGRRLNGMEAMEIDHEIASAVVAGGARRSARMSLMHWEDPQILAFIASKADPARHWSTNISVEIDDQFAAALDEGDPHAERVLQLVATGMAMNGEPGFVNSSLHSRGERQAIRHTNPCSEASLQADVSADGHAAGESCNLGSVNLERFGTDYSAAARAFQLMARFLYRATLNPHADPSASTIEQSNRRIGVGILGLQGWVAAHGRRLTELPSSPDLVGALAAFRRSVRSAADELADALGTPHSIKVTAVAPTGTIAQLCGTTPGIHPVYARRFLRRVRYADHDPRLVEMIAAGHNVVPDIYADRTSVVEFPVVDRILERFPEHLIEESRDISIVDFCRLVAAVQEAFCGEHDGQGVSATGHIPAGMNPSDLASAIRPFVGSLKGLTVFPDLSRPLSPYEAISAEEYERRATMGDLAEVGDSNDGECVGGACPIR